MLVVELLETEAWLDAWSLLLALEAISDLLLIELDSVFATALDVTSFSVMADKTGQSLPIHSDEALCSDETVDVYAAD